MTMFHNCYKDKKVLLTGHTGFKGSWLTFWLERLGAEVCGVALPMKGDHSHFGLLRPGIRSEFCDIRDSGKLRRIVQEFQPEIIFHLAAQPLVLPSYEDPSGTFATNVMGTVNVLEAARATESVRAIVAVSSDKCYENREWVWGYRETDPMGGYDPYSASKGCMELVLASYRRSFFHPGDYGTKHHILLASGRAGNAIGGGDWAEKRLVPDLARAAAEDRTEEIQSPDAVRPWQHVLEPLGGYLLLGEKLLSGAVQFADAWNFGPSDDQPVTVRELAEALARYWDKIRIQPKEKTTPHEAHRLRLDCSKAHHELAWRSVWTPEETFRHTALWYRDFYCEGRINTETDLADYLDSARQRGLAWTL